jgi:colanic acid biosynthesis glycosyl transferase WcaI
VDVCIASTPQFFAGLAGTAVRRLKCAPLCFEVRDLWPDSLAAVEAGAGGLVMRLLRYIERYIKCYMYRAAQGIVIVSPAVRAHIAA